MPSKEDLIKTTEKEVENLTYELEVCKEAKKKSEACASIHEFVEKSNEPFTSAYSEPNVWHKSQGGGGCIIL